MKKTLLTLGALAALVLSPATSSAQRQTMPLGRGVVAVYDGSNNVNVTWRRLAQEPENSRYNVYVDTKGGTNYKKMNSSPLSVTNYQSVISQIGSGSSIAVTIVDSLGNEGEKSVPFKFTTGWKCQAFKVNFADAGSPLTTSTDFGPKYAWPVDLDGDGEMEYVVNRIYGAKNQNGADGWGTDKLGGDCLEAYTREGKFLWAVNLGIHFFAFGGQNDGVTVGDFDGDGKGDVMVQVCEGARFWDKTNNTWGKYLYYNGPQASHTGEGTEVVSSDGTDPDIDKDGITNYTWPAQGLNPQYYMVVIDGMTGAQKDVCPMTLPSDCTGMKYTRTNKGDFMGDEYSYLSGAMGSAYLDGVHQSAVIQFCNRRSSDGHHYFTYGYGYNGGAFHELFTFAFRDNGSPSEFHHIRIGDVDGDGKDEVMNGAYALDHDGTMLWNSGINHGDRFRLSDIDPDRPGQEIFAIQQNAPDMLGMILYDATDGSSIKRWYMGSVGDVGRGECMDVDASHKGYEIWSTMANMYDCKGNMISDTKPYPFEGMWWDDNLGREECWENGSTDHNLCIGAGGPGSSSWGRQLEISKASEWKAHGVTGGRPMFWGDCLGDWREEIICRTNDASSNLDGFVCYSTNYSTSEKRIYCLLEDPNYFGQITNRGYYQSPCTSFYLGYDMPRPQLPPVIKENETTKVYGLTLGNATVSIPASQRDVYLMPVKNQTLTVSDNISGSVNLWKGLQGTVVANGNITTTGKTIISEGTLEVNGTISGAIDLRARGILSGRGSVGSISLEGSLNYAEGVIKPLGTLTVNSNLAINKPTYVEIDIDNGYMLQVKGDLNVTSSLIFNIDSDNLKSGEYKLLSYTGSFKGSTSNLSIRGVIGYAYTIENKDNSIYLNIEGTREATSNVIWTGATNSAWDYQKKNWKIDGQASTFVANDSVIFNDNTTATTVNIPELVPAADVLVDATSTYTFQGDGGLTGTGTLRKENDGVLYLSCKNSDYTGATIINGGTVHLTELSMQGAASSIGVGSTLPASWQCGKATMVFDGASLATDRGITLNDTTTFEIPSSMSTTLKGKVIGSNGVLHKTGDGQLSISYSAANSWKSTILESGILAQGTYNTTFGNATSRIHVTGDSRIIQFYTTSSGNAPTFQNAIEIDSAKTLTFTGTGRGRFIPAAMYGKGTLSLSSEYVRFDEYFSAISNFQGTINIGSGAGRFVQAMNMPQGTLNILSGNSVGGISAGGSAAATFDHTVGNITGEGTIGTGNWHTGYANTNATFKGNWVSPVYKEGTGIWLINPTSNTSTAALTVNSGEVWIAGTGKVLSSTTTVNNGAALKGKGNIASVIINEGGTIEALNFANATMKTYVTTAGTLTISGNLTMKTGSNINVWVYSNGTTTTKVGLLNVSGKCTLTSPNIIIDKSSSFKSFVPGQEMQILSVGSTLSITGDVTMTPAIPMEGYEWDLSKLSTDGIISIKSATPVETVEADSESASSNTAIYDISGKKVSNGASTSLGKGIFIKNGKKHAIEK